jgi:hypothetical protein
MAHIGIAKKVPTTIFKGNHRVFSVQKKRHLVKPFIICTADGLIVDVYGLFEGTKNDATILKQIFYSEKYLVSLIKSGDIFLVDRGFRDEKPM